MIVFTSFVITLSILSSAYGTTDLFGIGITPDPIRLPSVVPGESPAAVAPSSPKVESFLDKLTAPLSFFQGGLPCLGQTSLKAGNCKSFDACSADGGFGDGKGLCLTDAVCCVKPIKCGEFSILNNTVLANPGFPLATVQTGSCAVKFVKPFGISHIKLLIEDLELAQPDPHTGKCDTDALTVTGGVLPGFGIGKICGLNSKSHLYVPTVLEASDVFIKIDLADNGAIKRRWLIRVEFIDFKSIEKPPMGCAQYFREESGLITSFNFDLINKTGKGNIDGLQYGICFAPLHGACSIKFRPIFFHLGGKTSSHTLGSIPVRVARAATVQHRPTSIYGNRPVNYRPYGLHAPSYVPGSYYKPYAPNAVQYRPQAIVPVSPPKYQLPNYHRPSGYEAQRFPSSQFLVKLPLNAVYPFMHRPAFYPNVYNGQYTAPMKKPDVDIAKLDDKLDEKLGNKLDKLEGLADKLGLDSSVDLNSHIICLNQDTVVFPIPDDGTNSIHCGNDFHFGGELVSSFPPFIISVANKGSDHGKGFAVTYKVEC